MKLKHSGGIAGTDQPKKGPGRPKKYATDAERQAAWRDRHDRDDKQLVQVYLHLDVIAGLDDLAARHQVNRTQLIETLVLEAIAAPES